MNNKDLPSRALLHGLISTYLNCDDFSTIDFMRNGIQVESPLEYSYNKVRKVAVATDSTFKVIEEAIRQNVDVLLTHHGIVWGGNESRTFKEKEKLLIDAGCSLWSYHLPLDSHQVIGNNVQLAKFLSVTEIEPFGHLDRNLSIGVKGILKKSEFVKCNLHILPGMLANKNAFDFKNHEEVRIAIVSGTGGDYIVEAIEQGIQLFITGDLRYQDWLEIFDGRMNDMEIVPIGHHASEVLGIIQLGNWVASQYPEIDMIHINSKIYA